MSVDENSDEAYRLFKGSATTQHDGEGKPALPDKWYYEPVYHDGDELFSGPYDSAADAAAEIDSYHEPPAERPIAPPVAGGEAPGQAAGTRATRKVNMSNEREKIYDEHIAPLMTQIIGVCKKHGIPMVASFELDLDEDAAEDDPLMCTSILVDRRSKSRKLIAAAKLLNPFVHAVTEVRAENPDGTATITIRSV